MARPTNKQRRIKQAADLLENETLTSIFDERLSDIYERWKSGSTVEERETCYFDVRALEELRDAIYATARDAA